MIDCIICADACALGLTRFGMMSVLMLISTPSNIWSMLGDVFTVGPPGS